MNQTVFSPTAASQPVDSKRIRRILPGQTIGILGGGQLGRMIALKAREMGYRIVTMDPTPDSPCGQVADLEFTASLDDVETAREMAKHAAVITYEFENVSDQLVQTLQREAYLPQGSHLLYVTRNRIREKTALQQAGIPVAPWRPVYTWEDLQKAVESLGFPCVLKTASGGYDGKGQFVLRQPADIDLAWSQLKAADREWVLEGWVDFTKELSVIAARNGNGEVRTFPTAENIHRENILHLSMAPARIPEKVNVQAQELAQQIAEELNVIGLIAVEMFWAEGRLLVNELAPRPHNSGHYTMDACVTSQFEQHVRAICNLPLGDTRLLTPVVMANLLGQHLQPFLDRADQWGKSIKVHLYGKAEAKKNRKMGHFNVLASTVEEALNIIENLQMYSE